MSHWHRVRSVVERLLVGREVGVNQAGQLFGHALGSFLLLSSGLDFSALEGLALIHILLLVGGKARLCRSDHENLIQPVKMRRRLHDDIDEGVSLRVQYDLFNSADGEAARKDLVATAGEYPFARLDALIGKNINNLGLSGSIAAQYAANARGFKNHSRAAALIINDQNLGAMGKDFADFADNSIGSDDRHI